MDVEIWSDIACSWCYVATRRFAAALLEFRYADRLHVIYRSYQLDPDGEVGRTYSGLNGAALLSTMRGMPFEQARAVHEKMRRVGVQDGVLFDFESLQPVSTFNAHRVLQLAQVYGRVEATQEALMSAYFSLGRDVSDRSVLIELGAKAGLRVAELTELLDGDLFGDSVRGDQARAAAMGVHGVPFYLLDGSMGVSGAVPACKMVSLLDRAWSARPRIEVMADGATCGIGGC
jgi:predicted DsbA family dithiol-disulfide isomerase